MNLKKIFPFQSVTLVNNPKEELSSIGKSTSQFLISYIMKKIGMNLPRATAL